MNRGVKNRALMPDEVECRIDSIGPKSITLVVYITARSAMNLMDELYGPDAWSKRVTVEKKSAETPFYAVCSIEAHDYENDRVIFREDVGEDSNSPKAASSDALKRAAMNIIPSLRALYTLPQIRVNASSLGIRLTNPDNREASKKEMQEAVRFRKFSVNSISFGTSAVGEFVKSISILDEDTGEIVHEYVSSIRDYRTASIPELAELRLKVAEAGMSPEELLKHYDVESIESLADNGTLLENANFMLDNLIDLKRKMSLLGCSDAALIEICHAETLDQIVWDKARLKHATSQLDKKLKQAKAKGSASKQDSINDQLGVTKKRKKEA